MQVGAWAQFVFKDESFVFVCVWAEELKTLPWFVKLQSLQVISKIILSAISGFEML